MLQSHVMRYEIEQTEIFQKWLESLKDRKAVLAITKRLTRLAAGNSGDRKQLGENLFELRFFYRTGLQGLLHHQRPADCCAAGGWRQIHAGGGYQTGEEAGAEVWRLTDEQRNNTVESV